MSGLSEQELEFARPCPRDGYYDVFISFRGKDTRSGFTDTLYHSLLGNNVYTFIDADLAGNVIETLFEIIGRSRMAVVVYSEMFASSHWCLTELELIMQRWEEKKMLMIPIFYKVQVHELKHPTEKTIKYFDEHIKKYGESVVGKWRNVVTKIGNVSGFPYKDVYTRSERDFIITQVIVTIKKKLRELRETSLESSSSRLYDNSNNTSGSTTTVNHDVFISFLGKDTRFDLVNNLYKALMDYQKDIKIFKVDRDLLKDDNIFDAIQRSKMSVIVFSQNYTSSKWCLRELTKILECSKTMDQELVPIFYEITQPDLINQAVGGKIADHLQKHARNEKSETVQSWRNAITDLGNMVGWRYSTTNRQSKSEELADFIQELVEEISTILNRIEDEKNESSRNQQADEDVDEQQADDKMVQKLKLEEEESSDDDQQLAVEKGFLLRTAMVVSIDTHPIKPWLLLGLGMGSVCIWNYETRAEQNSFKVVKYGIGCAKFVHEKHWLVAGDLMGVVHVFDYNTSEKVKEFQAHEGVIECVAVHLTSPYVLTTSEDWLVKLWNWKNDWACIETFKGHSDSVEHVAFNPKDSTSFASASQDGTIKLWTFGSSIATVTIKAHTKELNCVEYFIGNDNKLYLLSSSDDYSAKVWDYESKTLVKTLEGHSDDVQATRIHQKLPIIITGSRDKTIRIWNKNTYRTELVWNCDLGKIRSMGFIKTSDEVVLGCENGMIVIKIVNAGTQSD